MAGHDDEKSNRRTKIVATLGPASNSEEVIEGLIRAGLDVARLNFSHGTHDDHRRNLARVRSAEARTGKPVAVLQDLQGPKIRLGKVDGEVFLKAGETAVLSSDGDFLGTRARLPTTYERLSRDVKAGELIQLADGQLELKVKDVKEPDVICEDRISAAPPEKPERKSEPSAASAIPATPRRARWPRISSSSSPPQACAGRPASYLQSKLPRASSREVAGAQSALPSFVLDHG